MEFNIFAGARRIAWFFAGVVVAIGVYYAENSSPYIHMSYDFDIEVPKFERSYMDGCGEDRDYFYTYSKSGYDVRVDLCPPRPITYRYNVNKGLKIVTWTGDMDYDTRERFIKNFKPRFHFSPKDEQFIKDEATRQKIDTWQEMIKITCVFLSIFFGIVSGIGWVVRGFLGLPTGMDRKPEKISFKDFDINEGA